MPPWTKDKRTTSRRVLPSFLLGSGIAIAFLLYLVFKDNYCWIFINGIVRASFLAGAVSLLAVSFLVLRWWGRLTLALCLVILYMGRPYVDSAQIALTQASAAGVVRHLKVDLDEYRRAHPQDGYPATLPRIESKFPIQKYYRFEYGAVRAKQNGPADDFVLRAIPIRRNCGYTYSFVTSSREGIFGTTEDRPATNKDSCLGP